MTLPQIIVDLLTLLFDLAVPAAICTMVLAGIALRQEGGVNFQTGGRFQRWVLWSVIFLTLPQFLSWFAAQGITMPAQGGGIGSAWVASLQTSFSGFVSNVVVAKLIPLLAAFCVRDANELGGLAEVGSVTRRGDLRRGRPSPHQRAGIGRLIGADLDRDRFTCERCHRSALWSRG